MFSVLNKNVQCTKVMIRNDLNKQKTNFFLLTSINSLPHISTVPFASYNSQILRINHSFSLRLGVKNFTKLRHNSPKVSNSLR